MRAAHMEWAINIGQAPPKGSLPAENRVHN